MEHLFSARNITKQYTNHLALNQVSLNVPKGSIYGLLGPNGAGKTTLLRIINQITGPDNGELFFKGQPLTPVHLREIGYLPEERGLYRKMKVGEHILYLARLKGLTKQEAHERCVHWFNKLDIMPWWDKKVEELSKGMQQKVQFISTIVHNPELIIFDEPFSGFDPINANILKNEILELRDNGATIIFSTHNMASVEELCSHISLINRSEIILEGDIHSIRERYKENIFEVHYHGDNIDAFAPGSSNFNILKKETLSHIKTALVKLQNGSSNDLLKFLVQHVNVVSFKEVVPGMNEIFIKLVEASNQAA